MVPIFKKGDKHQTVNYRPISLTSITCKVLEHIIHSSVMKHFDRHHILTDAQHGFRKKRSCETQLLVTVHNIAKNLALGDQVDIILLDFFKAFDKVPHQRLLHKLQYYGVRDKTLSWVQSFLTNRTQQVDVILLDFSKAFDKVPHQRLLHKLQYYGVRDKTLSWIQSFLTNRTQQVAIEGTLSSSAPVLSGVPQGTALGPLLFLTYINDLPDAVHHSSARLFADDSLSTEE